MGASFYLPHGPSVGANGARWQKPCLGKLIVAYPATYFYDHRMKITVFGETVWGRWNQPSTFTQCASGGTYVAPWNQPGYPEYFGAAIDIWQAKADALWTSSVAISVLADGRDVFMSTDSACIAGIFEHGTAGSIAYASSIVKKPFAAFVNDCSTDPTVAFTVTAYDDGSFTVA
jgi:hypothetical protein